MKPSIGTLDLERAERAVRELLAALGHDADSEAELRETPARVAQSLARELLAGERVDPVALVAEGVSPAPPGAGIVAVHGIAVAAMCPHHLLPALGVASVGYLPGGQLLGLGTLAAVVDACARRLVLQEEIGVLVTEAILLGAGARGAYCRLELTHSCFSARGARQAAARVVTSHATGALAGEAGAQLVARALGGGE
ncbi:MAG: GTP cyclohydrolase I [Polyangiaceae bacterium]|nr:GTP cyclohydrolase I [Polyangiaceae bacterium]